MLPPKLGKGSRDEFEESLTIAGASSSGSSEPSRSFGSTNAIAWLHQRRIEQRGREDLMLIRDNSPSGQEGLPEEQLYGADPANGAAASVGRGSLSSGMSSIFQKARTNQFALAQRTKSGDSFSSSPLAFADEQGEDEATSAQNEREFLSPTTSTTQNLHVRLSKMASLLSRSGPTSSIGYPSLDPFQTAAVPLDRTTFYLLKICRCSRNVVGTP